MIKYSDCLVHLLLHWSLTDYIHQRKWLIAQSLITSHLEFAEYFEHKRYVLCWRKSKNTFNIKSKSIKTAKWWAIGLKCDCHNLMLLDIWMCLVVWSNNYGIRLHQIILCLKDMFQPDHVLLYLLWTDFYSFRPRKRTTTIVPIQIILRLQGQEFPQLLCEDAFAILFSKQEDQWCVSTEPKSEKCPDILFFVGHLWYLCWTR